MTARILRPLIALALGLLALGVAQADQICRNDVPATAPDSRFRDNGDGTVTDHATGLVWKRCSEGLRGDDCATGSLSAFTWQQALRHAEAHLFAGSDQWRVPNKKELASLVEQRCAEPAINSECFPNTPPSLFWSSSPYVYFPNHSWGINFFDGQANYYNRYFDRSLRLVRGTR